jgi:F-type H+-transporting ATPase subunit alpha
VSRVGSAAQIKAIKKVAGTIKLDLAQYREMAAFAQFGSDLDAKTKRLLDRGERIVELFKQDQYNPIPVEQQVVVMWAMQNGFIDDVDVDRVQDFQNELMEYFKTRKQDLLEGIVKEGQITDELKEKLEAAVKEFKQSFK